MLFNSQIKIPWFPLFSRRIGSAEYNDQKFIYESGDIFELKLKQTYLFFIKGDSNQYRILNYQKKNEIRESKIIKNQKEIGTIIIDFKIFGFGDYFGDYTVNCNGVQLMFEKIEDSYLIIENNNLIYEIEGIY